VELRATGGGRREILADQLPLRVCPNANPLKKKRAKRTLRTIQPPSLAKLFDRLFSDHHLLLCLSLPAL
jgi:hypothetical protein